TAYPPLRSRGAESIGIVGAGEVVRERLVPALLSAGYRRGDIAVLTNDAADVLAMRSTVGDTHRVKVRCATEAAIGEWLRRQRVPTLIATPPDSHLRYARLLAGAALPFAVEKPITLNE